MIVLDFFLALVIALIFASLLVHAFGRRGPGPLEGLVFFLILLMIPIWAGGVWATPPGPIYSPWVTFLLVGLLLALLIGAATPPTSINRHPSSQDIGEAAVGDAMAITLGIFFWMFLLLGIVAIAVGYAVSV